MASQSPPWSATCCLPTSPQSRCVREGAGTTHSRPCSARAPFSLFVGHGQQRAAGRPARDTGAFARVQALTASSSDAVSDVMLADHPTKQVRVLGCMRCRNIAGPGQALYQWMWVGITSGKRERAHVLLGLPPHGCTPLVPPLLTALPCNLCGQEMVAALVLHLCVFFWASSLISTHAGSLLPSSQQSPAVCAT